MQSPPLCVPKPQGRQRTRKAAGKPPLVNRATLSATVAKIPRNVTAATETPSERISRTLSPITFRYRSQPRSSATGNAAECWTYPCRSQSRCLPCDQSRGGVVGYSEGKAAQSRALVAHLPDLPLLQAVACCPSTPPTTTATFSLFLAGRSVAPDHARRLEVITVVVNEACSDPVSVEHLEIRIGL